MDHPRPGQHGQLAAHADIQPQVVKNLVLNMVTSDELASKCQKVKVKSEKCHVESSQNLVTTLHCNGCAFVE